MNATVAATFAALQRAWPWWNTGYDWPWTLLWLAFAVLFWGSLMAILIWAVRLAIRPKRNQDRTMQVLLRRLAAGEITRDEYERIKRLVQD